MQGLCHEVAGELSLIQLYAKCLWLGKEANYAPVHDPTNLNTYIQCLSTKSSIAPIDARNAGNVGAKKIVKYEADYVFFKASLTGY
jgi:hypothetical protein